MTPTPAGSIALLAPHAAAEGLAGNRLVAVALAAGVATDGRRFVPPVPCHRRKVGAGDGASVTHLVRDISVQIAV